MSTLATPIRSREQLEDPACVKVVFDARGRALYFSRSPIPHARAVGRRAAGGRSAAFLSSTWACTPIAASFCCELAPNAAVAAGEAREARATARAGGRLPDPRRAWSTSRPSASTRPRITGRLSNGAGTLRCGSRVRRPWSHARAQVRAVSPEMSGTFDRQIALPLRRRGRSKVPDTFRQPALRGFPLLKPIPIPAFHDQTYFRHRRRGQLAGQGAHQRLDRHVAGAARPARSACRSSIRTSTSIRAR